MTVLALNIGSSSIKCAVYGGTPGPAMLTARLTGIGGSEARWTVHRAGSQHEDLALPGAPLQDMVDDVLRRLGTWLDAPPRAVGHRIVHGGTAHAAPVRLTREVVATLEGLAPLAPLHQPFNLAGVKAAMAHWPEATHVGCFDTAFHRSQPRQAQLFALPLDYESQGVIRYGFHGLSYEHVAASLAGLSGGEPPSRVIAAHLGHGASLCALLDGRSVASTMGFTALDGLPMGTRSGDLDPGVILYLIQQRGLDAGAVQDLLYNHSGLLGLSGISGDMRTLLASGDARAKLAIEHYAYRAGREIGSLAAALGGLDAVVFTGGVGENAPAIRAAIADHVAWLGLRLDETANTTRRARISAADSAVKAWVLPADEEGVIARAARAVSAAGR